jgi:hypothetical protein
MDEDGELVVDADGNPLTPEWAATVWYWLSYYLWVWLAIAVIFILFVLMAVKFKAANEHTGKNFRKAGNTLIGYPFIIISSWILSSITDLAQYSYPGNKVIISKA